MTTNYFELLNDWSIWDLTSVWTTVIDSFKTLIFQFGSFFNFLPDVIQNLVSVLVVLMVLFAIKRAVVS